MEKSFESIIKKVKNKKNNLFNLFIFRGNWTLQEDIQLLELVLQNGKKWALISIQFKNRNNNTIKTRFLTLMKKFKNLNYRKKSKNSIGNEDINIKKLISHLKNQTNNKEQEINKNIDINKFLNLNKKKNKETTKEKIEDIQKPIIPEIRENINVIIEETQEKLKNTNEITKENAIIEPKEEFFRRYETFLAWSQFQNMHYQQNLQNQLMFSLFPQNTHHYF